LQAVFGVENGVSSVYLDSGLSMQVLGGGAGRAVPLCLFSWGGGKGFFFIFPCFPMCFHDVPSKFLMSSQYVPQHVLHLSTSLLFHMLWQMLFSFHLYAGLKGGTIYVKTEPSILRSLHSFFWGAMGQSNWLVAPPPPQRTWKVLCVYTNTSLNHLAAVNQHPPPHHPLDAHYDSVVDEPQLG
jgi:hypothetical protein